jgi:hypothetical protein
LLQYASHVACLHVLSACAGAQNPVSALNSNASSLPPLHLQSLRDTIFNSPPCYLARILLTYKDFFKQKSAISIAIKNRGHKCIFIPKFYCEVNVIKIY